MLSSTFRRMVRRNFAGTARMMSTKRAVADDELCVITGGGSGIGQATTLALLDRGITTLVMDMKEPTDTAAKAKEMGLKGEMLSVVADVTSQEGREAVAQAVADSGKTLRILIHNAGVNTPCKMMTDLSVKEWDRVMNINMNGPLYLTQELYKFFGKTDTDKNRILMLSTIAKACAGLPNYGPYCVSKLGAYGIALMLKEELPTADVPVYTSTLIPGEVNTEMQKQTAYSSSSGFPDHLVKHWRMLHETNQLLPPAVPGEFITFTCMDTNAKEFMENEWFVYDNWHHSRWAQNFIDEGVEIVEPKGLLSDH
eukprot:CAMPEP_0114525550 /NCGR_PEP_ID=MMETSP0109-20121206/22495_1 /TAXON_ID=29199 /ORGANISM="Chlorarachnion reptans, Strain CCCM449" /LENGTH=310 /DNA_ID=CAMNT_0001707161 /DNA_START=27 /DNA_END=959 /DNA_ORIENTATION=-